MNEEYLDKYRRLIAQRKSSPLPDTEYGEKHHIKPRCICPEEDKNPDNIVRLSAYEHFIAHYYLMRIYEDTPYAGKMVYAFRFMNTRRITHFTEEDLHKSALMYEDGKKRFSQVHLSEESRKKLSESLKGHPAWNKGKAGLVHHSDETKQKLSDLAKQRTFSDETRKKMSDAQKGHSGYMKGKHHSEESKKKISESLKGRPENEEWRRKISEAKKGTRRPEAVCRKISESKKGKPGHLHTEESKRKISEASRRRRHSEETRKKLSEMRKGKPGHTHSEETKKRMSEVRREYWRKKHQEKETVNVN